MFFLLFLYYNHKYIKTIFAFIFNIYQRKNIIKFLNKFEK